MGKTLVLLQRENGNIVDILVEDGSTFIQADKTTSAKKLILGDDTPDGDVVVEIQGDLVVKGTQTITESEIVNINENRQTLNAGITDNSQNSDASYEVKRLDDETGTGRGIQSIDEPTDIVNLLTGHGIVSGDFIEISGATNSANDGVYKVSSVNVNAITIDNTYNAFDSSQASSGGAVAKLVNAKLIWDESELSWYTNNDLKVNNRVIFNDNYDIGSAVSGAVTFDLANGAIQKMGISGGDVTLTLSNPKLGTYLVTVTHDSSARNITFPAGCYHVGQTGTALKAYSLESGTTKKTMFTLLYDGANYYVTETKFFLPA